MDQHSILDLSASRPAETAEANSPSGQSVRENKPVPANPLRFPTEDGGRSLKDMARRDLDATLLLLAERAQYITGASGAAIALCESNSMICRASVGSAAPQLGAKLQVNSGLTGESIRKRQILRCDNAESDSRANRESCRALGIASVVVIPLVRDREVLGVFELLASRTSAFEERDINALERLGAMVLTALEHASAANRVEEAAAGPLPSAVEENIPTPEATLDLPASETVVCAQDSVPQDSPEAVQPAERGKIGVCEACGFPVSEGRLLCLDCEADQRLYAGSTPAAVSNEPPMFLAELAAENTRPGWLRSHIYSIAVLVLAAAAAAAAFLRLR